LKNTLLSCKEAKELATFIYSYLNDYIKANEKRFFDFISKSKN